MQEIIHIKETRSYTAEGRVTLILIFIILSFMKFVFLHHFLVASLTLCVYVFLRYVTNIILISKMKEMKSLSETSSESPYLALLCNWYVVRHFLLYPLTYYIFADNTSWVGMFIGEVESTRISYVWIVYWFSPQMRRLNSENSSKDYNMLFCVM